MLPPVLDFLEIVLKARQSCVAVCHGSCIISHMALPTMLQCLTPTATQWSPLCWGAHVFWTLGSLRMIFWDEEKSTGDKRFIASSQGDVDPTRRDIVQCRHSLVHCALQLTGLINTGISPPTLPQNLKGDVKHALQRRK